MADEYGGGRGFTLSHQRVVLDIDFIGVLSGTAHLTIHPTNPSLRTVYLHASPLLNITGVTLSSETKDDPLLPTPASYAVSNAFQPLPVREPPIDLRSHQEIKRKTWAAMAENGEGELAISVSHGWVRLIETSGSGPNGRVAVSLAPIQIQIQYQLALGGEVVEGIVFRRPGDGGDESQIPHMYLSPTSFDAARIWTPCVDNLWERCTWELQFIVPRYLEGGEPNGDQEAFPTMVVASGELIEQVIHPTDPHKVIFSFLQPTPTSVQHIAFAAGPFELIQVPSLPGGESQRPMLAFCLPGQRKNLENSTSFLSRAMSFYTTTFGSYPFSVFQMVFVVNPRAQSHTSATLAIFSSDLLHPDTIIDQAIETRLTLSFTLIKQWVGINIIQRTLSDTWLIVGLALFIHGQFIRHLLGNNEYRFRLKKDIDRCVRLDQGDQQPLCMPGAIDPPSAIAMAFMSLKAPLVMHILDRHLAKAGTSLSLMRVIPRIFLSSLSDELPGNMLSTASFFRTCRKVSGMDLLPFQDQWIFGSGCPHITIKTNFIRKKFLVEFAVQQQQPAIQVMESMNEKQKAVTLSAKRPTPFFEGSLTVRIHEADGAPFEHLVDIKQPFKVFPLPFNTKYKRTRRSGHVAARFSKLQDALEEADDNDADQVEQLADVDRSEVFAYPPWEDEEVRRQWRVHDWNEEEAAAMIGEGGGYEWIRVDPECEWLASFDIQEKPWFWISQLQGDRDVVAQLQAVQRMTLYPSPVIASELARVVLVENYFFRVRMEAARALVAYNSSDADYMGLFLLLKLFQTLFCHPSTEELMDPINAKYRPLPNDFSNFASYYMKKSIITALSELRDPATRMVWRNVRQLLLDLLNQNDNSANKFSDSSYLATLIAAIGNAFSTGANSGIVFSEQDKEADRLLLKDATDAVERAITVDRLVPSFRNVVTQAGLQAQLKSILVGQRTNDPRTFLSYTREGNYIPLRIIAFDCLLLCKPPGRSNALAKYLVEVIRKDYSLTVRRHVARALSESIIMTLAVGEVYMGSAAPGIVEVNTDSIEQREKEREQEHNKIVKALRKEFTNKLELRQYVQEALIESFVRGDNEIRFALIKAAEVMTSGVPEPKPGALITLPTPTAETAPVMTPKIRLSLSSSADTHPDAEGYGFPRMPVVESPASATSPSAPIKLIVTANAPMKEKKKAKNVPKAQSKGLSDSDFKAISITIQRLMNDKRSTFFRQPVDPVRDDAPDYLTIVREPMDLSTVRAKFDSGMYASRQEFADDVRLVITNCYLYNVTGSPVRKAGEAFEKFFNTTWVKTENTLNQLSKLQPAPAAPTRPAPPRAPSLHIARLQAELMPPPPVPPAAAGVRLKLKTTKSFTADTTGSNQAALMAPPPVPVKATAAPLARIPSPEKPKEKEKVVKGKDREKEKSEDKQDVQDKPTPKKKREVKNASADSALDDLLGAEVDAMTTTTTRNGSSSNDELSDLLAPPPHKKIKLSTKPAPKLTPTPPPTTPAKEVKPVIKKVKIKTPSVSASASTSASVSPRASTTPSLATPLPVPLPVPAAAAEVAILPYVPVWPRPSPDLPPTSQNPSPFRQKRAKVLVQALVKDPDATYFLRPVDPIRDGCPTYYDEIREPSDYQTITKNIDGKKYSSMGAFARDIELIFANCRQFNPPGPITDMAAANEAIFWREWPKAVSSKMTPDEKKAMQALLTKSLKEPKGTIFREAVDPVKLGIPGYFDIIPQEDARDLSLIRRKLDKGEYSTARQVDEDINLMLENARVYNGEGPIMDIANQFGTWWKGQRSKMEV